MFITLSSTALFGQILENTRWKIESVVQIDGIIGNYSLTEKDNNVGKILEYFAEKIVIDGNIHTIKKLENEYWTEEDLYKETHGTQSKGLLFSDLGYYGDKIMVIKYRTQPAGFPGEFIFMIGKENCITLWNGTYYLMEKVFENK